MKDTKGITLVVLVVTIVILLILAGTTIGIVSNNDGLLENTGKTKENVEKETLIQKIEADIFKEKTKRGRNLETNEIEKILKEYGTVNYKADGEIEGIITKDGNYEILLSEIIK